MGKVGKSALRGSQPPWSTKCHPDGRGEVEREPEARDTPVTEAGAGLRVRALWATGCATPGLEEAPQLPHRAGTAAGGALCLHGVPH